MKLKRHLLTAALTIFCLSAANAQLLRTTVEQGEIEGVEHEGFALYKGIPYAEAQYMLYQIINERYNRRKPTILISNQAKKDFLNYIGIAAADRLTESAQVVEFTGKSYRRELRAQNA